MPRGRPVKSEIRQNIIEILHFMGEGYGYQVAKIYNEIFPTVTQRSVYYHLRKGVQTEELEVHKVKVEKGDYSWGDTVEKIYYSLGNRAEPRGKKRVQKHLEKIKIDIKIDTERMMSKALVQSKSKVHVEPEIPIESEVTMEEKEEPKKKFGGLFSRFRREK
ncbi:hypothetical protein HQ489_01200 [Candidatus Woesearchaeota archaeon]|nr:hypothetical protein [Candidatus Woesearchaeota archaeon]